MVRKSPQYRNKRSKLRSKKCSGAEQMDAFSVISPRDVGRNLAERAKRSPVHHCTGLFRDRSSIAQPSQMRAARHAAEKGDCFLSAVVRKHTSNTVGCKFGTATAHRDVAKHGESQGTLTKIFSNMPRSFTDSCLFLSSAKVAVRVLTVFLWKYFHKRSII